MLLSCRLKIIIHSHRALFHINIFRKNTNLFVVSNLFYVKTEKTVFDIVQKLMDSDK